MIRTSTNTAANTAANTAPKQPSQPWLPWRTEVLLLLGLALVLRVLKIAATELWLDEACSIELARHGPIALLQTLISSDASPHPPLYFLLLSAVVHVFGEGSGAARLPSLLAGVALVGGTAEMARRMAGRWPGRLAGLIAAVAPLGIHYSVEARSYSLLALLSLALAAGVAAAMTAATTMPATTMPATTMTATATESNGHAGASRPSQRTWTLGLMALAAAASLTHFFALFLLPLPLLVGMSQWLDRSQKNQKSSQQNPAKTPKTSPIRAIARLSAALLLAMLPAIYLVGAQLLRGAQGTAWLQPMRGPFAAGLASLEAMGLGTQLPPYLGHAGVIQVGAMSHGLGVVFLVGGVLLGVAMPLRRPEQRMTRRALVALAALAAGAPLVISLWRPLYLPGRYELAAMAPLHSLAAVGWFLGIGRLGIGRLPIQRLQQHFEHHRGLMAGLVVGAAICGLSATYLPTYLQLQTVQPFALLSGTISEAATAQTAVIYTKLSGPPTAWQLRQADFPGVERYFPAAQRQHPCWLDKAAYRDLGLPAEAKALSAELLRAGLDRVFVIVTLSGRRPPATTRLLLSTLKATGWHMVGSRRAGAYGIAMLRRRL